MNRLTPDNIYIKRSIEISIRLVLIFILLWYNFKIISPFFSSLLWGMISAVALFPLFNFLQRKTGLKDKAAAVVVTLLSLIVLAVPFYFLVTSLVSEFHVLAQRLQNNEFVISPPPENIAEWPIVGKKIASTWSMASKNIELVFTKYESYFESFGSWFLTQVLNLGSGFITFILSLIFAGIFLANHKSASLTAQRLFVRLAGKHGEEFAELSENTILNVTKGVLGVAIIQATLAGIGFFLAGVPGAGIWTLACLMLSIVQIGLSPVIIPVVIYMFYTTNATTGSLLLIWLFLVTLLESVLKPILLGKGSKVPTAVIFIGVLGGFISFGIIGMFIGSVIFSIGYRLFLVWLNETTLEK